MARKGAELPDVPYYSRMGLPWDVMHEKNEV